MSGMIRSMPGRSSPRERHAEIDHQPVALAAVAEAVEREVHADLADAAERHEDEFAGRSAIIAATSRGGKHSPAVIASSCPSAAAASGGPSRRASRTCRRARGPASRTTMSPPSPAARASQSARIAAKPAPRSHCASRASHRAGQRARTARPASPRRRAPQDRSPDSGVVAGWCAQLTPMPTTVAVAAADALRLEQDAGELGAVEQQVVRPFQLSCARKRGRRRADRVVHRQRRHEAELGRCAGGAGSVSSRLA